MSRLNDARIYELIAAKTIFTTDLEVVTKRNTELKAAIESTETPGDDVLKEVASTGAKIKKLTTELATLSKDIKQLEKDEGKQLEKDEGTE